MSDSQRLKFGDVTVSLHDGLLEVSNGKIRRVWRVTDRGLLTIAVDDLVSGRPWGQAACGQECDWELPVGDGAAGELISLDATESDDQGFSSEHVRIACCFRYPAAGLELSYIIWLYHGFAGMRTQLQIKSLTEAVGTKWTDQGKPVPKRIDLLPVSFQGRVRRYFGYYSDTQNRNDPFLDILKEETADHPLIHPEWITWASAVCLEEGGAGIAMVKESHKCVNHPGHDSGMFVADPEHGVMNLGWGVYPVEIPFGKDIESWGTWLFCWNGEDHDRHAAFKAFDRLRYPIHPERDAYMQANTWGSTVDSVSARRAAGEASVLREIACCAELGIDVLQIDDGWQLSDPAAYTPGSAAWTPDPAIGWRPHPAVYPNGWKKVAATAREHGVKLGLWAAAEPVSLKELIENHDAGDFVQYKLDSAHLDSRRRIDELMDKARKFILYTKHQARVNWDLTEINPRYGYFFAREYGTIYLENRKPVSPLCAIYRPDTVLRDLWQISRYLNLSKFQATYQNIDLVSPQFSNAQYYSHAYCFAITMMATPLFFQETKYLSAAAKAEIIPLIRTYKAVRREIYAGTVYPVGDKPNGAAWCGFQNVAPDSEDGFLTVFRELDNQADVSEIRLYGLKSGTTLRLTNLLTGETAQSVLNEQAGLELQIPRAPGFLFLRYAVN